MNEPQIDWLSAKSAKVRRDTGIRKAAEHANKVVNRWQEIALEQLRIFIRQRLGAPFLAEDFVRWSKTRVPAPPDMRAYGSTFKRAAGSGLLVRIGYAPAASSNHSPKCLWQASNQIHQDGANRMPSADSAPSTGIKS